MINIIETVKIQKFIREEQKVKFNLLQNLDQDMNLANMRNVVEVRDNLDRARSIILASDQNKKEFDREKFAENMR